MKRLVRFSWACCWSRLAGWEKQKPEFRKRSQTQPGTGGDKKMSKDDGGRGRRKSTTVSDTARTEHRMNTSPGTNHGVGDEAKDGWMGLGHDVHHVHHVHHGQYGDTSGHVALPCAGLHGGRSNRIQSQVLGGIKTSLNPPPLGCWSCCTSSGQQGRIWVLRSPELLPLQTRDRQTTWCAAQRAIPGGIREGP
jgi:hypothetical protein